MISDPVLDHPALPNPSLPEYPYSVIKVGYSKYWAAINHEDPERNEIACCMEPFETHAQAVAFIAGVIRGRFDRQMMFNGCYSVVNLLGRFVEDEWVIEIDPLFGGRPEKERMNLV